MIDSKGDCRDPKPPVLFVRGFFVTNTCARFVEKVVLCRAQAITLSQSFVQIVRLFVPPRLFYFNELCQCVLAFGAPL
jgi:hypothetical protein